MNRHNLRLLATAAMLAPVAAAPSTAQQPLPVAGVQPAALPSASAVAAFYNTYRSAPMWFRGATANPAAGQLVAILRRAQFDGFAAGPQLAPQVEAAIARASTGRQDDVTAAEQVLSSAWVMYVQALKRPTPGMDYANAVLQPQGTRADQILLTAAAAPALDQHLAHVSRVNPIYAQLRDAAWSEAQATGNLSPDPRLLINLDRARTIPGTGRFVVVDAAGQRMTMFDNGQPVDSMKIIVGNEEFPTPMIASFIHYVTLNPYWDSPDHLVRRAIAPNVVRQGFGYMKSRGYEVMADWTVNAAVVPNDQVDWKAVAAGTKQIRIRQKPGPQNFMATMKIPFVNDHDIYLHDTPAKNLFAKSQRALSNGCVRLEDAPRFARWLLGHDPVATSTDPDFHIRLPRGIPIYLTYLTAQPRDGKITYTADVYGWDKAAGQQVAAAR